jgi:hypothetical protein
MLFQRPTWVRPTAGSAYGLSLTQKPTHSVPTPTASDHIERACTSQQSPLNFETNKSVSLDRWVRQWPTPRAEAHDAGGTDPTRSLYVAVRDGGMNLQTAAAQWPTPASRDYRTPSLKVGTPDYFRAPTAGLPLNDSVGGALSPTWVEKLMGLPPGWTDLGAPTGKTASPV